MGVGDGRPEMCAGRGDCGGGKGFAKSGQPIAANHFRFSDAITAILGAFGGGQGAARSGKHGLFGKFCTRVQKSLASV